MQHAISQHHHELTAPLPRVSASLPGRRSWQDIAKPLGEWWLRSLSWRTGKRAMSLNDEDPKTGLEVSVRVPPPDVSARLSNPEV